MVEGGGGEVWLSPKKAGTLAQEGRINKLGGTDSSAEGQAPVIFTLHSHPLPTYLSINAQTGAR